MINVACMYVPAYAMCSAWSRVYRYNIPNAFLSFPLLCPRCMDVYAFTYERIEVLTCVARWLSGCLAVPERRVKVINVASRLRCAPNK